MAVKRRRPPAGIVLAPGAGAGRDQPGLVAIDERLSGRPAGVAGVAVQRMDFPYRLAGRRAPDRPLVLMEAVRTAAATLASELGVPLGEVALGGRSMGGRISSMVAAEGFPTWGLVLVSYPLHPPGRPERARTAHFPAIPAPCLFVSGDRDAFATPEELTAATATIPAPVTHEWIPGADHGLRRREDEVAAVVESWLSSRGASSLSATAGRRPGRSTPR